ncbi:MAG: hypothetical protein KDC35_20795 [Acidobacteria bacterium]|nr:hypothetical protein [Acidobacteriota bacterium]
MILALVFLAQVDAWPREWEVFFLTEDTVLYKGENSRKSKYEIKQYTVLFPGSKNVEQNALSLVAKRNPPPNYDWGAVTFPTFKNIHPNRYHVQLHIGDDWVGGWVDKSTGEIRKAMVEGYSVFFDGNYTNVISPSENKRLALLILDELAFANFKPPEITNEFVLEAEETDVWLAVVEVLADAQIPIKMIDSNAKLIITETIRDPKDQTMACATVLNERGKVSFKIVVRAGDGGTRLKINSRFDAERDGQPIECSSNGTLERWICDEVKAIVE